MQFEADTKPLREILVVGQHLIPRYQRRYAWDDLNIKEFWDDLKNNQEGHFLGSMVVCGPRSGKREVVDGQQRITTALILLSVLRDEYYQLGETKLVEGINPLIKYTDLDGCERFRLENGDVSAENRLIEAVLTPENERKYPNGDHSGTLEVVARDTFKDLIHTEQSRVGQLVGVLNQMRDSLLKAEAVYVWADNRRNAFGVFETLNDRGQSLTVVDLVKNTLLSRLPEEAARQDDKMWANAIDFVERAQLDGVDSKQFLYYHWNSIAQDGLITGEPVEEKKIRRSVEVFLGEKQEEAYRAKDFLQQFLASARIFDAFGQTLVTGGMSDPWRELVPSAQWDKQKFDNIAWHLYGVLVTGASQPFMLLIALMRKYLDENHRIRSCDLISFIKEIKNFQFRWSIAGKGSTSTHRRLYRKAATAVNVAKTTEDIKEALEEFKQGAARHGATDNQFQSGLGKLLYSKTRKKDIYKVRYILREMESIDAAKTLDFSRLQTIEHIEPQAKKSENTTRNNWVFKLGNLMLLPGEINSKIPNDFAGKAKTLAKYVGDNDVVLREAINANEWNNDYAGKRQRDIEMRACRVWPMAAPSDPRSGSK